MKPAGEGDGGGGGQEAPTLLTPAAGATPPAASTPPGTTPPPAATPPTGWQSALPPELQEHGTIKNFKSVSDLAGAYVNAQKMISGDKMPVPNNNWTDTDWKNFYSKAGLPETLDKYEVAFKPEAKVQDAFVAAFKENAHKAGVLPKQAQGLADWFSDITAKTESDFMAQRKSEFDSGVTALKQEWGNAFDARINQANKLIVDVGGVDHFKKMGYGSDPVLMKFLGNLAAEKYKDPKIPNGGDGGGAARTPQEIDAAIARMQTDQAYMSADHPGHKTAVDQMAALHQEKFQAKR